MNKTQNLIESLRLSQLSIGRSQKAKSARPTKSSVSREKAQIKYKDLTNLSKNQQCRHVKQGVKTRNPEWKYEHKKINSTFSVAKKEGVDEFPHNNKKYNVQFLDRSLKGQALKFPVKETGLFPKPQDTLYSKHFVPIAKQKRKYNQDYELRTSMFGKTWVDFKRQRIMDKYEIQTNPFNTQRSNQLMSTMRPARKHVFS